MNKILLKITVPVLYKYICTKLVSVPTRKTIFSKFLTERTIVKEVSFSAAQCTGNSQNTGTCIVDVGKITVLFRETENVLPVPNRTSMQSVCWLPVPVLYGTWYR